MQLLVDAVGGGGAVLLGDAPDRAIGVGRAVNGQVQRTRPLCAYPKVARYSGQGSIDDAANFSCVAP